MTITVSRGRGVAEFVTTSVSGGGVAEFFSDNADCWVRHVAKFVREIHLQSI